MSSYNKKKKEKNNNSRHGQDLKISDLKLKRHLFFNSAIRKKLKRLLFKEFDIV